MMEFLHTLVTMAEAVDEVHRELWQHQKHEKLFIHLLQNINILPVATVTKSLTKFMHIDN